MITKIIDERISSLPISIFRDDLLPMCFGGNKARLAKAFFEDALSSGANAMLIYGSPSSNLCRTLAFLTKQNNMHCSVLCKANPSELENKTVNQILSDVSFDDIYYCRQDNVQESVDMCLAHLKEKGYSPYYIYNDTSIPAAVNAYASVYNEIAHNEEVPDYIFVPVGTGMTFTGLLLGREILSLKGYKKLPEVVGISVSRDLETEYIYIRKYLSLSGSEHGIDTTGIVPIMTDITRCGGYNIYNVEILNECRNLYMTYGIPADPVYVGKAYLGMVKYSKEHASTFANKKVMFIHTGSSPLFVDRYDEIMKAGHK